ncbi:MAG: four helix bundle protein [Candidatus Kerfeldbacteria bacterium]|nr:four helix bundle protein [Candidatus Kerfeldbacteria bacterium]
MAYKPPPQLWSNLPILQKASDAYKIWHGMLQEFPRLDRFTVGAKVDSLFGEVLEYILLAGYSQKPHKLPLVQRATTKLDAVKFFLNIAWEIKSLDNKKYIRLSTPLTEIGKMLGGWRKQLQNETPSE